MKKTILKILVFVLMAIVTFYLFRDDKWMGFYYPNYRDLTKQTHSSELASFEECLEWVERQVALYNPSGKGYDYECGKNCRFDDRFEEYVCKETVQ